MTCATSVLLLEDEPLILMDLELAAEELGCECLAACSSPEALALLGQAGRLPEVAVLDFTLQHGDTCQGVAAELRRLGIPYILHSGDLGREDEHTCDLDALLVPKPANPHHVIACALGLIEDERLRASG